MSFVNIEKLQGKSGAQYWRSLNELAGTSQFRDWVSKEFPGGVEGLDGDSRRNVLKLMAASFGLAGLAACRRPEEKILPMAKGVEDIVPGKPFFYNTVFTQGGSAVGITVESHDGRPTKIEGAANHPQSMGAASGHAQAAILSLYDPDRSKEVLQSGRASTWKAWDEFAAAQFTEAKLGKGEGLRILSELVVSPTLDAQRKTLLAKFPAAQWIEWEPINQSNALEGAKIAFGQPLQAHYQFDKADVVVALDSDFLGLDAASPRSVKLFSKRRRVAKEADTMNRLYSVEAQFSVTGAMADHRLRAKSSDVDAIAASLLDQVGPLAVVQSAGDATQKFVSAVAKDLKAHAGKSIVIAGPRQSPRVHAIAFAINQILGNVGTTVTLTQPVAIPGSLDTLAADLNAGKVSTLVILGGNPVYTAPKLDLKKAATVVHLGYDRDETAVAATWHVPAAHFLEAWGDARSIDGTVTIQQPLIAPMFDGRSAIEITAQLAGSAVRKGYELVKANWKLSEPAWRKALHDGVAPAAPFAEVKASANAKNIPPAPAKVSGTEVLTLADWSVYDGRYANNAWLQETPDPMSKLVWDNAALVSLATAKKLGVVDGDRVKIGSLEIAAMIQPGQADDVVVIPLGYGRTEVGRVGKGTGFNAYSLGVGVTTANVSKGSGNYQLVTTQEHHSMEGRPIVREATLEHWRAHPDFAPHAVHAPDESIYGYHKYDKGYQWGMAIDLNSCIGCNACLVACVAENNIPSVGKAQVARGREMHWIRLDRYYTGSEDDPQAVIQPLPCQQCEAAPCESVCPVAATVHSPEGLNEMAYNRCVGTRYCANNCPYKVRRFNFLNYHKTMPEVEKMASNPDVTVRMRGVMEKCTYCVQRIQEKKILAKTEGRRAIREGEILTACQQTCPAEAIVFGDVNNPESAVSKLKAQSRNYALLAEVNTRPRTTYLAKLRNPNPDLSGGEAKKEQQHHG
ncbi:MAG: TAT-variant-translocated molybdopterin oxidoreductase [Bryobacteraceae bacterium]|nr:TAT-variant-translocated molybdopterin oxidoreductase [Bryobacteraceae bacterium]